MSALANKQPIGWRAKIGVIVPPSNTVNEAEFNDNSSQYEAWTADADGYKTWMTNLIDISKREERTHGFHHVGGYQEQISNVEEE